MPRVENKTDSAIRCGGTVLAPGAAATVTPNVAVGLKKQGASIVTGEPAIPQAVEHVEEMEEQIVASMAMSKAELLEMAFELEVDADSTFTKQEIVSAINNRE